MNPKLKPCVVRDYSTSEACPETPIGEWTGKSRPGPRCARHAPGVPAARPIYKYWRDYPAPPPTTEGDLCSGLPPPEPCPEELPGVIQ
jgi:hypothetical protein